MASDTASSGFRSQYSHIYRGATVEDLDLLPALSCTPTSSIDSALETGYENEYTHLTVVDGTTRALIGYLSIPRLKQLLAEGKIQWTEPVSKAMIKFRRKAGTFKVITPNTPLEELEEFFKTGFGQGAQDFAVVTDGGKFVYGVATEDDLVKFRNGRPNFNGVPQK